MTVALTWTCADHPEIDRIDPGRCPDGRPTVAKRTPRPHGNHNPQHGGQFFMAPDNTHHLEGVYPRNGLFRLYLYDDYARPLSRDQLKGVKARVVTQETFDAAMRTAKEVAAFPLVADRGAAYLEAGIDGASLPAQMAAKVQFKEGASEYRFDFTFQTLSKEPGPPSSSPAVSRVQPPVASPAPVPAAAAVTSGDPGQARPPIPESVAEVLGQLKVRNDEIRDLVGRGDFAAVWVPAFQAKDLAIALEAQHLGELPVARRAAAEPALERLVRAAWLLDAFGDIGNRHQIADAYVIFASAVADVVSAFTAEP